MATLRSIDLLFPKHDPPTYLAEGALECFKMLLCYAFWAVQAWKGLAYSLELLGMQLHGWDDILHRRRPGKVFSSPVPGARCQVGMFYGVLQLEDMVVK